MPDEQRRLRDELAVARAVIAVQRQIQSAGHDLARVMRIVATTSIGLVGGDGAVVEIVDGADLVYRATAGDIGVEPGFRVKANGSLSGMCVELGTALRCDDTATDSRVARAACERVGVRSMVVVPLVAREKCAGVLKVTSRRPHAFTAETGEILEAMASFIGMALHQAADYTARAHDAAHDGLTGLLNRRSLLDRLDALLRTRADLPVSVFFVDLDGFKAVNDTDGHAAGDAVLSEVAERLREVVREHDTVARLGGDEFVVVCPGLVEVDAAAVRERVRDAAAGPLLGYGGGASVGVVRALPDERAARLLERADAAMYGAKATRRRNVRLPDSEPARGR